jgi:diguanylate cyclase (GGDEF)-like protein
MATSLRARLIGVISLVLIAAFLTISVLNYRTTKDALHEEIVSSSLPMLRENIYSELQKDFVPSLHRASLMANDSFLKNWALAGEEDSSEIILHLSEIREKYDYFSTFFVSELTGNYYYYDGILKTISTEDEHDVWYYRFVESGREYVLDVDTNQAADDRLTIFVNYRVDGSDGRLLGVTGVGIRMENFSDYLRERQEKYDREIYLVDRNGVVQAHTDVREIHGQSVQERPGIGSIAEAILSAGADTVDASYRQDGSTILVTSRYMPELDWYLIVEQDEGKSLSSLRGSFYRTVALGLLASGFVIAVSILIINYFQKKLEQLTVTDELTKTANRRGFQSHVARVISRFERYATPASLLIVDVDHFKQINDRKGHLAGDKALNTVVSTIQENVRPEDFVARWGGDDFALLLEAPGAEAEPVARRIREVLFGRGISVSMGLSELRAGDTADDLVHRADSALYRAKESGRNAVVVG